MAEWVAVLRFDAPDLASAAARAARLAGFGARLTLLQSAVSYQISQEEQSAARRTRRLRGEEDEPC